MTWKTNSKITLNNTIGILIKIILCTSVPRHLCFGSRTPSFSQAIAVKSPTLKYKHTKQAA